MREIKFRAWNKYKKQMYDVLEINLYDGFIRAEEQGTSSFSCFYDFDKVELMQSTGLFDMYNKEIFEGDIVKFEDEEVYIYSIFWSHECSAFKMKNIKDDRYIEWVGDMDMSGGVVIGNIYKNSDLINC